jgi:hypothetical protein
MSLLGKRDRYSPEEIASFIQGIKDLEALRDKAQQTWRLTKTDYAQREYNAYTQNIASAQKTLNYYLTKVTK